jgi:hypothetical protein
MKLRRERRNGRRRNRVRKGRRAREKAFGIVFRISNVFIEASEILTSSGPVLPIAC